MTLCKHCENEITFITTFTNPEQVQYFCSSRCLYKWLKGELYYK